MPESKRRKPKNRPQSQNAIETAAKAKDPSPTWYVALMAGLMVVGVLLVLARFVFQWPQTMLLVGLGAIAAGFLMTTNYR
jgi:small-conductance mechanosensitive channel